MIVQIWINENGSYYFYKYDFKECYFVLRNGLFAGIYDSLDECKEYTVDFDNLYGASTFEIGED